MLLRIYAQLAGEQRRKERPTIDMRHCLLYSSLMSQWPDKDAFFRTLSNLQLLDFGCESICKLAVYSFLDHDSVGSDTSLARVSQLGQDASLDSCLDLGIIKDDEGTVPAEFEAKLLQAARALFCQEFSDSRRAREAQLFDELVCAEFFPDFSDQVQGGHNIDGALWQSSLLCQHRLG